MTNHNEEIGREELHFRRIDMRAWRRADGLYEVEGRVTDRKPHDFTTADGMKRVPANEPIHDMGVRLVFDEHMLVHEVSAFIASAPFGECLTATGTLQELKGLRLFGGWAKEVKRRLGGAKSCTHLMEILIPMASAAFQSLTMARKQRPEALAADGKPLKVDSCYGYAANRGVVMRRWPNHYTGNKSGD